MTLYRDDHGGKSYANPHSRPLSKAFIETTRKMEATYRSKIALLPVEDQAEFKIIPTTPVEAIPLVKKFMTPELIAHVDKSPALRAAETAAVKRMPQLEKGFAAAREEAATRLLEIHRENAARQLAERQSRVSGTKSAKQSLTA